MENATTAASQNKSMTPVAEAHSNLANAHISLSEELAILEHKLHDILTPVLGDNDSQKEERGVQDGVSAVTALVQQETNSAHGFISRIRNLIERLEV